jgi:hypothetical protein
MAMPVIVYSRGLVSLREPGVSVASLQTGSAATTTFFSKRRLRLLIVLKKSSRAHAACVVKPFMTMIATTERLAGAVRVGARTNFRNNQGTQ